MNPIPSFIHQILMGQIRAHGDWPFSLATTSVVCVFYDRLINQASGASTVTDHVRNVWLEKLYGQIA